ncbi:RNA methyltransferase [Lactobacillus sp. S2-2]|uniref:TrmH family RNA methyltransferase n=1 Tax=Lactobacillus sp. S2-2 TaxID=2692917 RepID=UPI001F1ABD57|nr:RNA methyltransferase [Lactobacillus sp. S2-2]MCF6515135.1 RNA methyltransferase [Lactobacillus sp. S2-2]
MDKILSKHNKNVKEWQKLKTSKGQKKENSYIIETWHLVEEAINYNQEIELILVTEEKYNFFKEKINDFNVTIISEEVANSISSTVTNQGIFAICKISYNYFEVDTDFKGGWILLDNVQDPGNIGTIVRTADAAGLKGVVFGEGTANMYNDKVLRSMQGSQYHVKLVNSSIEKVIEEFKEHEINVYGTELNPDAYDYTQIKPTEDFALIMGNEGNGMRDNLIKSTDKNLYIPIKGSAESLNVAIAAALIMFKIKK